MLSVTEIGAYLTIIIIIMKYALLVLHARKREEEE